MSTTTSRSRGHPRRTQAERTAETRRRMLDAAATVFATKGIEAATIAEISAAAGLTAGAFYWNFHNKDELLLAVLEARAEAFHQHRDSVVRDQGRIGPSLDAIDQTSGERSDLNVLRMEAWLYSLRHPEIRPAVARLFAAARAGYIDMVDTLAQQADIGSPIAPELAAVLLLAVDQGVAIQNTLDPGAVPDETTGLLIAALFDAWRALADNRERKPGGASPKHRRLRS